MTLLGVEFLGPLSGCPDGQLCGVGLLTSKAPLSALPPEAAAIAATRGRRHRSDKTRRRYSD